MVASDGGKEVGFEFETRKKSGTSYSVSIESQPQAPVQTCTVANGSGSIGNANVASVVVDCTANKLTIGGTITGLSGSLVLENNGGDRLTRTTSGSFTFPTGVESGAAYSVTVGAPPAHQQCTIKKATGTVRDANVTDVEVSCAAHDVITVTSANSEALTEFQVPVTLSPATFGYHLASAKGDDLRFSTDGVSFDVPYWTERWNPGGESRIWLKVPNIPANGSTKIHVLYGDLTRAAASNGSATFEAFDDFEDGVYTDKWDTYGDFTKIEESGGELYISGALNWAYVASKTKFTTPVVVHADMRTRGNSLGLILGDSATRLRYTFFRYNGIGTNVTTDFDYGADQFDYDYPGLVWSGGGLDELGAWSLEVAARVSGTSIEVVRFCNLTAGTCNETPKPLPVPGLSSFVAGFSSTLDPFYIGLYHARKYASAAVTATLD